MDFSSGDSKQSQMESSSSFDRCDMKGTDGLLILSMHDLVDLLAYLDMDNFRSSGSQKHVIVDYSIAIPCSILVGLYFQETLY
jgi:hypothetical protein